MLEEGSFRRRTADFVMMFIFGGICMIVSFANYDGYCNQFKLTNVTTQSDIHFLKHYTYIYIYLLFLNHIVDFCILRQSAVPWARIHNNVGVRVVTTKSFCQDELFRSFELPSTCLKAAAAALDS